MLLLIAVL